MAHVAKYNSSALGRMCGHYERAAEKNGYQRDNIDNDRTHLNYNLGPKRHWRAVDFIDARIEELELKRKPRADAVKMCDCVVTLPQSLGGDDAPAFFESCCDFLADRYGAENVVSAWVHMDESQPHMHFAWVPVTKDGRLSAKDVVNRADLKTLHHDMQAWVEGDLGRHVEILLDPDTKQEKAARYTDMAEFKAARAAVDAADKERERAEKVAARAKASAAAEREELETLTGAVSLARQDLSNATAAAIAAEEREKAASAAVAAAEGRLAGVQAEVDAANRRLELLRQRESRLEEENEGLRDSIARADPIDERCKGVVAASHAAIERANQCYEECISARASGFRGSGVPSAADLRSRAARAVAERAGAESRLAALGERCNDLRDRLTSLVERVRERVRGQLVSPLGRELVPSMPTAYRGYTPTRTIQPQQRNMNRDRGRSR